MTSLSVLGRLPVALADLPLRVGFDLVEVQRIQDSMERFGDRFLLRLFSNAEIAYACSQSACTAERLAARFAAKEAAIKALSLSEVGAGWRDIEVRRGADGACSLALYGRAAQAARALGVSRMALSLSHDGGYAGAVVSVVCTAVATGDAPTDSYPLLSDCP